MFGSAAGAFLAGSISDQSLKLVVTVAMFAVAAFIVFKPETGVVGSKPVPRLHLVAAFVLTFLLGIYGGLFSGGYVTVLTVVLAGFFGLTFSESVASTKLINVVSSSIATAVFMWQGLVNYRLGLILGVTTFAAAYFGAHYAVKLNDTWLKRIFIAAVILLAIKTLFDIFGH
jgi:uncharacterized membrane protein YfcA